MRDPFINQNVNTMDLALVIKFDQTGINYSSFVFRVCSFVCRKFSELR